MLAACSHVPGGVIKDEDMAQLLADLELADAVMNNTGGIYTGESVKMEVREQVLDQHGVTAAELDSSLAFYGRDLKRYNEIFDRAIQITQQRLDEANKAGMLSLDEYRNTSVVVSDADSLNLWTAGKTYRVSPATGNFIIPFAIPSDHNGEPGDKYVLRFKAIGQGEPLYATLAADYSGLAGTDFRQTRSRANKSQWVILSLNLDPDKTMKELYGAIGVDVTNCNVWIDSISLMRVRLKDHLPNRNDQNRGK